MGEFRGKINREGRPKGKPNKTTQEIRESFSLLLSNNLEKLQSDLNELEPFQRIKILLELSKFIIPTLKAADITTTENKDFTPVQITFEEVQHIKEALESKY